MLDFFGFASQIYSMFRSDGQDSGMGGEEEEGENKISQAKTVNRT